MAQLPPRIPSSTVHMSSQSTGYARNPPSSSTSSSSSSASSSAPMLPPGFHATAPPEGSSQPSWVEEFLDYSAARRSHHRRSVSDFGPPQLVDEVGTAAAGGGAAFEFDRLDDDQLMYMFSVEMTAATMMKAPPSSSSGVPASSASPSSPSDYNVKNEEKPAAAYSDQAAGTNELEEAQSECKMEMPATEQLPAGSSETITDPKRVKRILANRQSAQRSRVRKLQYISELERSVTTLQSEVSALSPRVAFLDHQRTILTVGNSQLKQRIAALAQDNVFKDAHQEALRKEIGRLRQVYNQQNVNMIATPTSEPITCSEKELLC